MVVGRGQHLQGDLSKPVIFFLWAQGTASRVRRLPAAPTTATMMHLVAVEAGGTHRMPARVLRLRSTGKQQVSLGKS